MFFVRVNAGIVLCVPPVRNVHKCEYGLITTEQLTVTHQYSYSYSDIHLCFCQYLYVFSVMIACRYRYPTHAAKVRQLQVQTDCSVHNLGAVLCLQPTNLLFYLTINCRQFLFVLSTYYRSHSLSAAHTSGGLTTGSDKR